MMDLDWEQHLPDGSVLQRRDRVEFEPIYCMSCGKYAGHVPTFVSFASWMCAPCSEKYGVEAAQSDTSDRDFWRKVNEEMVRRFGRALTDAELSALSSQGKLGRGLELLERESPYRGANS